MAGSFIGKFNLTFLDDDRMQLINPISYVDPDGDEWPVPAHAIVDGASIPWYLWSVVGHPYKRPQRNASVVHDWYCDRRTRHWQAVHRMFYHAMITCGSTEGHAKRLFAAVWLFGPRWNNTTIANNLLSVAPGGSDMVGAIDISDWKRDLSGSSGLSGFPGGFGNSGFSGGFGGFGGSSAARASPLLKNLGGRRSAKVGSIRAFGACTSYSSSPAPPFDGHFLSIKLPGVSSRGFQPPRVPYDQDSVGFFEPSDLFAAAAAMGLAGSQKTPKSENMITGDWAAASFQINFPMNLSCREPVHLEPLDAEPEPSYRQAILERTPEENTATYQAVTKAIGKRATSLSLDDIEALVEDIASTSS